MPRCLFLILVCIQCSFIDSGIRLTELPESFTVDSPDFLNSVSAIAGRDISKGNHLEVLRTGDETFVRLRQMLLRARHHIHIETYLFNTDSLTREFSQILINQSLRGVRVVLIVDSVGGFYFQKDQRKLLEKHGVEVYTYNPWNSLNPLRYRIRNHRRSIVIDGKFGMMGGFGLTTWWLDPAAGPYPVEDTQVYLEGPVVRQLQSVFAESYRSVSGNVLSGPGYYPAEKINGTKKAVLTGSNPDIKETRSAFYELYQLMIESGRKEIIIVTPYFIPDRTVIELLKKAVNRNVRVELILTDGKFIFEKPVYYSANAFLGELLEAGVKIYIYERGLLHAKMGVIDRKILLVGSTNFDQRSLKTNLENDIIIPDRELAEKGFALTEEYKKHSRLLTLETHNERSWWSRFNEILWIPLMHEF